MSRVPSLALGVVAVASFLLALVLLPAAMSPLPASGLFRASVGTLGVLFGGVCAVCVFEAMDRWHGT